jgi:serine/threonine protein kinase/WD40 repeat protein
MPDSEAFDELLDRWEEEFEQGRELSPEELCRDHPDYLDSARKYIRALKAVGSGAAETGPSTEGEGTLPGAPTSPRHGQPAIPGYEIIGELGRGGMGVVYRARQTSLKRLVALKMVLREDIASPDGIARFRAEAEALGQLQHPNIVQVYDVGEIGGHPYFALELVPGGSLHARLEAGPALSPREAAELIRTVARAVHFAHEQGFVYRDLKPGNILLGPGGEPKVTDFGLVKRWGDSALTAETAIRTASGEVLGTPGYMAPEQASGDAREFGPGIDIYALGAILYELLTGSTPFVGQSLYELLDQIAHSTPLAPGRLRSVPRDLDTICLKCLEKSPDRRYLTADHLADDLERFLEGKPILARPVTLPVWFARWCRRNPYLAGTSITAFLGLLTAAIVSVVFAIQSERSRNDIKASRDKLEVALATSEEHRKESVRRLAENCLDRGLALCDQGEVAQGMWWLVRAWEYAGEFPELAAVVEANLSAWSGVSCILERTIEHPGLVTASAISPDGRLLATALKGERGIRAWSLATGEPLPLDFPDGEQEVASLAFHPSEPILAAGGKDRRLRIWRVRNEAQLLGSLSGVEVADRLQFSGDGRWLGAKAGNRLIVHDAADGFRPGARVDPSLDCQDFAFLPGKSEVVMTDFVRKQLHFWDFVVGKPGRPSLDTPDNPLNVSASPDGGYFAVSGVGGLPVVYAAGSRVPRPALPGPPVHIQHMEFDPRSTLLLMAKQNGSATLWNVREDRPHGSPMVHAGVVSMARFTPAGRRVVTSGADRCTRVWRLPTDPAVKTLPYTDLEKVIFSAISPNGQRVVALSQKMVPVFSPEGQAIDVLVRDEATLWDVAAGKVIGSPLQLSATKARFDASGRRVLFCGKQNHAHLWNLATGELNRIEPASVGSVVLDGVFSPDGNRVFLGTAGGTIHVWDLAGGKFVGSPMQHGEPVARLLLNAEGTRLFASGGPALTEGKGATTLWNAATGERVAVLDPNTVLRAAAFSPDGRWLAASGKHGAVRIWDAATGTDTGTLLGHSADVKDLAFHPEGNLLASASDDGTVRLWRFDRRELVGSLRHPREVEGVSFSPDGRTVLTRSHVAGAARLWDVAALRQLGPPLMYFQRQAGYLQATLLFSPDGKTMLTAGESAINFFAVPSSGGRGSEFWANRVRALTGQDLDAGGAVRVLGPAEWRRAVETAE